MPLLFFRYADVLNAGNTGISRSNAVGHFFPSEREIYFGRLQSWLVGIDHENSRRQQSTPLCSLATSDPSQV